MIFLQAKVGFLRRQGRQSEVLSGQNEAFTQFLPLKVRILRWKVMFVRRILKGRSKTQGRRRRLETEAGVSGIRRMV